ncbi:MAG TPA: RNA pseudouridine synthase [Opitutaceae bacterium]
MSRVAESFWATLPLGRGVELITHDSNGLAALAKPAGVLSHPNTAADQPRSLLTCHYAPDGEYFEWSGPSELRIPQSAVRTPHRLWLLNRLDSATSGVILVAAGEALAREIRAMFQRKHVRKVYNALVFGVPSQSSQTWRDFLAVQKKGGVVRTTGAGNIPAEAQMTVLRQRRGAATPLALIKLEPRTGRSHQLRVQCAKRGLPIVGDATYGDFAANRAHAKATGEKRLFLHSLETRFDYDFGGRQHHFAAQAPLPAEFVEAVK